MTLRVAVMIGAALLVLAWLWWRGQRLRSRKSETAVGPGIIDEAATAYEDVADQIISSERTPSASHGKSDLKP